MKVYITVDLEGINGVVLNEQVFPDKRDYALARGWMMQEVNAAIAGAVEAGAREVVVNDSHNTMTNLIVSDLHPAASLISGSPKPMSMVQGLDASFGAAFFIGYHAKIGTMNAVQDHTYSSRIFHNVLINDISVGEFGLNAGMAGHFGVPIALITGDHAVVQEAKALVPDVEAVIVKQGTSRYSAQCYPFAQTLEEIRQMARRAVELASQKQVFKFPPPLTVSVEFQKTEFADAVTRHKRIKRVNGFSVTYDATDYIDLYETFLIMLHLCK